MLWELRPLLELVEAVAKDLVAHLQELVHVLVAEVAEQTVVVAELLAEAACEVASASSSLWILQP